MAVILIEGFDHFTLAQATGKGWSGAFQTMPAGRFGGQGAQVASTTITKAIPASGTVIVGVAFRIGAFTSGQDFLVLRAGTTNAVRLSLNASNIIQVRNSGGTVIATGTSALLTGIWNFVEVKAFINGASGTVEVHLNGVSGEIVSTAGNFGSSNIDNIGLVGSSSLNQYYFDDLYVVDTTGSSPRNTFLGDVRVATVMPNGDGAHTQWTPDSGTAHYSRVNEATPDGDTSYVSDSTVGHLDSYTVDDIDGGATVFGVQVNLYARKDDANARQIAPLVRQASTDYVGTTVTLASAYQFFSQIYNQDPTSADWTAANVNGDEFGVKEIA